MDRDLLGKCSSNQEWSSNVSVSVKKEFQMRRIKRGMFNIYGFQFHCSPL